MKNIFIQYKKQTTHPDGRKDSCEFKLQGGMAQDENTMSMILMFVIRFLVALIKAVIQQLILSS